MAITKVECFHVQWPARKGSTAVSAWVRVHDDSGFVGIGEASPMAHGSISLFIVEKCFAKALVGENPLDGSVLIDKLYHENIKLGPDGALAAAIAALDIALWDLKGKLLGHPIYRLLGGAWRTKVPFYTSYGKTAKLDIDTIVRDVQERVEREGSSMVKLRISGDRTERDADIPLDLAKARALRKAMGPDFRLAFDGNNGYSISGAIRVGRELEDLGYVWFEEPLQHYHEEALVDVTSKLAIPVAAGEQSYTVQAMLRLINAGVTLLQPDIVKMGGITGMQQIVALAYAHGVDVIQHQTQPVIGQTAALHVAAAQLHHSAPLELNDASGHQTQVFSAYPVRQSGHFELSSAPGLGLEVDEEKLEPLKRGLYEIAN